MTIEQGPACRPQPEDALAAVTEILKELDAALALVRNDHKLQSLVAILEEARAEAERSAASLRSTSR